jgi:hypothetical protein
MCASRTTPSARTDGGAGRFRAPACLGEHGVRVRHVEGEDDGRAAQRQRGEGVHLRELVGDVLDPSPMRSRADMIRPSGVGMRSISSAPNASAEKATARSAPCTGSC